MVDLGEIQAAYYMVAATGVLVAAAYIILNMRATQRNMKQTLETRQATFENNEWQKCMSLEWINNYIELMGMQWTDFEDFKRKYDARVNPENYCKRLSLWSTYDSLGYLYRSGVIDFDTIANIGGKWLVWDWLKFKPIIEEYRKTEEPTLSSNFEYLAEAVMRVREKNEPDARARMDTVEKTYRVAQ